MRLRLAAFLLAPCALAGCGSLAVDRPTVEAVRVRVTGLSFEAVDLAFDVDVRNPYPIAIRTPRFEYGMDLEGARLFEGLEHPTGLELPAQAVGTAVLPVRLTYSELVTAFSRLFEVNQAGYRLHGALLLDAMGKTHELPVSHEGTFPVPHAPRFSNASVEPGEKSLSGVTLAVSADVENPNVFEIDIARLGYALQLGEVSVADVAGRTAAPLPAGGKGKVSLEARVSGLQAVQQVLGGGSLGDPTLVPVGSIGTPFGELRLPDVPRTP